MKKPQTSYIDEEILILTRICECQATYVRSRRIHHHESVRSAARVVYSIGAHHEAQGFGGALAQGEWNVLKTFTCTCAMAAEHWYST